jgi:hypothetical protein
MLVLVAVHYCPVGRVRGRAQHRGCVGEADLLPAAALDAHTPARHHHIAQLRPAGVAVAAACANTAWQAGARLLPLLLPQLLTSLPACVKGSSSSSGSSTAV